VRSGRVGVERGPRDPDTRSPSRQKRLAEFGLKPLKAAGVGGSGRGLHAGDFNWGGIIR